MGSLERHPTLKVVQPHCGGVLPYLWGRVEHQTEVMGRGMEHLAGPARSYYRRVYLDMVSPFPAALAYAHAFAGADRLLFASDHPWVEISTLSDLVDAMQIPAADKVRIFGANACELFGLD